MSSVTQLKFRDHDRILTLWPEKTYPNGVVVGWCPELKNNYIVDPRNIVDEEDGA